MKWTRTSEGTYVSEDGMLQITRYFADYGYKTAMRGVWTVSKKSSIGWEVLEDVHGLAAAKKWVADYARKQA